MIRHIVALDSKRGIAKHGVQPWKLPQDEHYFNQQTMLHGGVVLMGRKTYEVIGEPLSDRQNFVLTRDTEYKPAGVTIVHDLDVFFEQHQDVWVIGGAEIYKLTLTRADELYVTEIDYDFECDRFYPEYVAFELVIDSGPLVENGDTFRFKVYKPRTT